MDVGRNAERRPGGAGRESAGEGAVTMRCSNCGEPIGEDDRFCEACGRPSASHAAATRAPRITVPGARLPDAVSPSEASIGRRRAEPNGAAKVGEGNRRPSGGAEGTVRPEPGAACVDCGAAAISPDGYCEECGLRQPSGREHIEIELGAAGAGAGGPVQAAGVSDRGLRRARNEDALAMIALPGTVCAVVCDGVASVPGSEEAAWLAAETGTAVLARRLSAGTDPEAATRAAIDGAARAVARLGEEGRGSSSRGRRALNASPACTYVSAVVTDDGVTVGWVGDSRAYWLAHGASEGTTPLRPGAEGGLARPSVLLTLDDSWAARMIARNAMTEAAAMADPRAHMLTGWLGADADTLDPHPVSFVPGGPGVVLICSDGLWNDLPGPADLTAALADGPDATGDPLGAARVLVRAALDAGGHDNITVALIPFPPPAARETLEPARRASHDPPSGAPREPSREPPRESPPSAPTTTAPTREPSHE